MTKYQYPSESTEMRNGPAGEERKVKPMFQAAPDSSAGTSKVADAWKVSTLTRDDSLYRFCTSLTLAVNGPAITGACAWVRVRGGRLGVSSRVGPHGARIRRWRRGVERDLRRFLGCPGLRRDRDAENV